MVHPLCLTSHQAKQPNQITCGGIQGREFKTNMVQRESLLVQVCSIQSMYVGQLNGKLFGMKPFLDFFYLHPPYVCAGGWAGRGIFGVVVCGVPWHICFGYFASRPCGVWGANCCRMFRTLSLGAWGFGGSWSAVFHQIVIFRATHSAVETLGKNYKGMQPQYSNACDGGELCSSPTRAAHSVKLSIIGAGRNLVINARSGTGPPNGPLPPGGG